MTRSMWRTQGVPLASRGVKTSLVQSGLSAFPVGDLDQDVRVRAFSLDTDGPRSRLEHPIDGSRTCGELHRTSVVAKKDHAQPGRAYRQQHDR